MITYAELKEKPKEFLAATSLHLDEFERLLPKFKEKLAATRPPDNQTKRSMPRKRRAGAGPKERLATDEDKLVFILVYQKTYPLQTMLGLHFKLSQPRANYWIHHLMPLLQQTLAELEMTPARDPQAVAHHPLVNESAPDLLIDGTERRRQRHKDAQKQTEHYSGKKKTHTDKNILLANQHTRKVVFLGPTEGGQKHDKKAADETNPSYPPNATLGKDTGFQGYEPHGVLTFQPKKKPRGQDLSVADHWLNKIISGVRIIVENTIAGVKRCRIIKDVFRNTKDGFSDLVMEVACALHNLRMECRHPLPKSSLCQLSP